MTDLDLPQLHVGRYVDLIRRRKWQLVPAGLVGLGVGLLVASLIPRYYEAETLVRVFPPPGSKAGPREDPFLEEVRKATNIVKGPEIIRAAVQELGWPVPFDPDDDQALRRYVFDLRKNISVTRFDAGRPGASSALIEISYRDQDGKRAAAMANKIRDIFLDQEREGVLSRERAHLNKLITERDKRNQAWTNAVDERREWLTNYRINPDALDPKTGQPVALGISEEANRIRGELADLDTKIEAKSGEVDVLRERLTALDEWREKDPVTDPELQQLLQGLDARLQALEALLRDWNESHPDYAATKREYEQLVKGRELYLEELRKEGKTRERNPEWNTLKKRIENLQVELEALRTTRRGRANRLETLEKDLGRLPEISAHLAKLKQRIDLTAKQYEAKETERAAQETKVADLQLNQDGIIDVAREAYEPPEPTYPNKMLVALLGAALGLGSALGMILLFDMLQSTFKSFDEVTRGLSIPVLGGMSYLELEEDLRAARAKRIKITLVTVVVLVLIAGVFAVYFIDPVRLPAWLRDALDGVFGAAE